jgi:hypothetical protein
MFKIIVDTQGGIQRVFLIQKSGSYTGSGSVIWNEKEDGLMPSNLIQFIGGLVRVENELQFNQAKWDAYQTWLSNKTQTEAARKTRVEQAQTFIKNLDLSGSLTATQIQNAIKALVVLSRND